MAGRGPAPKPADRRARRNSDPVPLHTLRLVRSPAPKLPADLRNAEGKKVSWHPRTREWWKTWCDSELSNDFTATDWSFLLDTAYMHHLFWAEGKVKVAAELRLRVAKFGATPEDRARLRIVFAEADERESRPSRPAGSSARARRGPLKSTS